MHNTHYVTAVTRKPRGMFVVGWDWNKKNRTFSQYPHDSKKPDTLRKEKMVKVGKETRDVHSEWKQNTKKHTDHEMYIRIVFSRMWSRLERMDGWMDNVMKMECWMWQTIMVNMTQKRAISHSVENLCIEYAYTCYIRVQSQMTFLKKIALY